MLSYQAVQDRPEAIVGLFSGGNDSSVLIHLLRADLTHVAHINIGISVPQTNQFVYDFCERFGLDLIEEHPPKGETYEDIVMKHGFPGPHGHQLAYSRLKERGLRKVRKRFVQERGQKVIFVSGTRGAESRRRMGHGLAVRGEGSITWVAPLWYWSNAEMEDYRRTYDVPRNEVADNLHMSGECLCGAFAKPGELDEIAFFYPEVADKIRALEAKAKAAGVLACKWGVRPPGKPAENQPELNPEYADMARRRIEREAPPSLFDEEAG